MSYKIVALPGDGIGPEILNGSLEVLEKLSEQFNFDYEIDFSKTSNEPFKISGPIPSPGNATIL